MAMWNESTLSLFLHRLCKLKAPKVLIFAILLLHWSENVPIRADASWLAIAGVMSAVQGKAVVWLGLVCSSFTVINMGWSKRSSIAVLKPTLVEALCDKVRIHKVAWYMLHYGSRNYPPEFGARVAALLEEIHESRAMAAQDEKAGLRQP
ncbi:hypothetical protein AK812_SmicGene47743, partial [Symbiodinium microadriaticum]